MNVTTRKYPLQRAHRLGAPKPRNNIGNGRQKPRPIIVNFLDFQDREAVRFARKNLPASVSVNEDFPKEIRDARKSLMPQLKELKNQNKNVTIAYPARLISEGKVVKEVKVFNK